MRPRSRTCSAPSTSRSRRTIRRAGSTWGRS